MEALLAVHKHVTRKQGEEDKLDVVDSLAGIFDTHFDIHLVSYFLLLRCVCSCMCRNVHGGVRGQFLRVTVLLLCVLGTELRLSALVANTFAF